MQHMSREAQSGTSEKLSGNHQKINTKHRQQKRDRAHRTSYGPAPTIQSQYLAVQPLHLPEHGSGAFPNSGVNEGQPFVNSDVSLLEDGDGIAQPVGYSRPSP